jgi:hypothetical protein
LTKANNVVSDTLKIVHTKFSPTPMSSTQQTKMKRAYPGHNLYTINEEVMYSPEDATGGETGGVVEGLIQNAESINDSDN